MRRLGGQQRGNAVALGPSNNASVFIKAVDQHDETVTLGGAPLGRAFPSGQELLIASVLGYWRLFFPEDGVQLAL
ncbi:hypothetical protein [Streptomyces sp. NPDC093089]|uniref:hypothetical protein n=1 Tax=Streptomyces sp. NPDC093089 TaxID=3366024 RepID=UPI00381F9CD4